jgi:hypothetical protein
VEEKNEYYLLYYGEWERESYVKPYPKLTYCVNIGDLTTDMAEDIAKEYEINYSIQSEILGTLPLRIHGFSPEPGSVAYAPGFGYPAEGFFRPFWEMYPSNLLSGSFRDDCVKAMLRFEDDDKSGANNEVIKSLHQISRHADKVGALKQSAIVGTVIEKRRANIKRSTPTL